ncbi:MAG: DUF2786 domain-containing protein [Gammaproteobacteria bacterium]
MKNRKIIDKIFKCLRLSESNNPNESAAALRQAQRLMDIHGINSEQVQSGHEVEVLTVKSQFIEPPYWLIALSDLIGQAFFCRAYVSRTKNKQSEFYFIGIGNRTELASYTFTVLQRLLARERRHFVSSLSEMKKSEKTRRGNVFAQAWLFRIARTIVNFVADPIVEQAIDSYVKQHFGVTSDFESAAVIPDTQDISAISDGYKAAEGVSLFRPVNNDNNTYALSQ